ncbi:MAG TPA: hypothetical protein VHR66_08060 [Gemmataceae bacterium]|jgi:hypothetical protein|nr:hypothetical protein [Gemmataceae bacterium]
MKKAIRTEDSVGFRGGFPYDGVMQEFLLKHGRFWEAQPIPTNYPMAQKLAPGYAFANATMLAIHNKGLRYVEGLAYGFENETDPYSGPEMLRHHAWGVDANDRVVDPTWGNGIAYFGVQVQLSLASRMTGKVPDALQLTSVVWKGGKLPPAPIAGFAKRRPIEKVAATSRRLSDRAEFVGAYVNGPAHVVLCGRERGALRGVKQALREDGWKVASQTEPFDRRDPFWGVEVEASEPTKDVVIIDRLLWTAWLNAMKKARPHEVGDDIFPDWKLLRAVTYKAMEKYRLAAT